MFSPYTQASFPARVHVVGPCFYGQPASKQIEAATAKSAGREPSETPRPGPGSHAPLPSHTTGSCLLTSVANPVFLFLVPRLWPSLSR